MCNIFKPHQWSKWKLLESGDVIRRTIVVGKYYVQKRECAICGRLQIDTIDTY